MRKISRIKLAQSIRVGNKEHNYLTFKDFDMTLEDGVMVRVTEKMSGAETFTSLFNCAYWEESKPELKVVQNEPSGIASAVRGSGKKAKAGAIQEPT